MEFLTSDSHFFHNNIIKYCNRPFDTVEEMNEGLIEAWNNVVREGDTVYHLGDLSFAGYNRTKSVLKRLNGNIIFHIGNHDRRKVIHELYKEGLLYHYHEVGSYLKRDKQQMWLTHYPMEIGVRAKKWSVCGHIHDEKNTYSNQINVGVDSLSHLVRLKKFGEPIRMDELVEYMKSR